MHPNSLANLRPPVRKGEPGRNPGGRNQYTRDRLRREKFEAVCLALAELDRDDPRRAAMLETVVDSVLDGAIAGDSLLLRATWLRLWDYG